MVRTLVISALAIAIASCATSPTGRKQLNIMSDGQMQEMGVAAYADLKKKTPISQDPKTNEYVRCIANAITTAIEGEYAGGQWEVNVFKDDSANAFALPGGKIGVHTGIMKVAVNQDQLATVMGHEVAHVLAKHGAERMSQVTLTQTGLDAVRVLAGEPTPAKNGVMAALGLGAQYGVLMPFGRTQESEADLLGLDLMAKAGFDPRESVKLWVNMGKAGGGQPPEWMSTHPSHNTRIADLENRIPSAMSLYQQAQAKGHKPQCQR